MVERLKDHSPADLGVTIITVAELWFGARKSSRPTHTRRELDGFLDPFEVLPFDREAAEAYARSRLALERAGQPIGERRQRFMGELPHQWVEIYRNCECQAWVDHWLKFCDGIGDEIRSEPPRHEPGFFDGAGGFDEP